MKRLVLGTAQFGLDYGISNKRGVIPSDEVFEILKLARKAGVEMLDTAQAYGTSEDVIGAFIKPSGLDFKVISKLSRVTRENVLPSLRMSLDKTGVKSLYGVLLHDFDAFQADPSVYDSLLDAKDKGITCRIGFSLYHPWQAEKLLSSGKRFDLVQVPYNILDRRFEGILPALNAAGVEVHARSIFLQGLLLMSPRELPPIFSGIRHKIISIRGIAQEKGVSPASLCAAYVQSNTGIDRVVVGVDSLGNLEKNLLEFSQAEQKLKDYDIKASMSALREDNEDILLPQNWSKLKV